MWEHKEELPCLAWGVMTGSPGEKDGGGQQELADKDVRAQCAENTEHPACGVVKTAGTR